MLPKGRCEEELGRQVLLGEVALRFSETILALMRLGLSRGRQVKPSPPGTAIHGKTSLRFFSVTKRETSAWASRREAAGYLRSSSCVDTDLRLEVVLVVMVDEERRDATRHVRSPPSRVLQVPSPLDVTAKLESWGPHEAH